MEVSLSAYNVICDMGLPAGFVSSLSQGNWSGGCEADADAFPSPSRQSCCAPKIFCPPREAALSRGKIWFSPDYFGAKR